MALAPRIQARQSQQLAMTPQLQQAIKLLRLSNIELAAFVEEQLEKNPLLERGTGEENRRGEGAAEKEAIDYGEVSLDAPGRAASDMDAPTDALDPDAAPARDTLQPADVGGSVDWNQAGPGGSFAATADFDAAANTAEVPTLSDHLRAQLGLAGLGKADRAVADALIGWVDAAGYLRESASELAEKLGTDAARIEGVLGVLRGLEPAGVFARDLAHCLSLQLADQDALDAPMQALVANLPLLARHELAKLKRLCGVSRDELSARIERLRRLDPKPGARFASDAAATIAPDVFVRETPDGGWAVELNSATLPRVLVNHRYAREIASAGAGDAGAREFVSECRDNASWLVKSLDQRAKTILKVSTEIVRHQDEFFLHGVDRLRPLKLAQIADAIGMNESTVSRVTTNKFMATPRGTFELKYFFTTAIAASGSGEGVSAEAVRHKIQILISEERADSVLSDDAIVARLRDQGVTLARRTVAKYRDQMGVPSSSVRRRKLREG